MTRQSSTSASARPRRQPLGYRNRLTVKNKDDNYQYRIVNDVDDRIQLFQEQGYEIVPKEDVVVGDKRVDTATALGSNSQIPVGQGTKAVVMRIHKDWYKEDQAAKQRLVDEQEQTMKGDARKAADYGGLNISVNTKD